MSTTWIALESNPEVFYCCFFVNYILLSISHTYFRGDNNFFQQNIKI